MKKLFVKYYYDEDERQHQGLFLKDELLYDMADLAQDCPEDATLDRSMFDFNEMVSFLEKCKGLDITLQDLINIEFIEENFDE